MKNCTLAMKRPVSTHIIGEGRDENDKSGLLPVLSCNRKDRFDQCLETNPRLT